MAASCRSTCSCDAGIVEEDLVDLEDSAETHSSSNSSSSSSSSGGGSSSSSSSSSNSSGSSSSSYDKSISPTPGRPLEGEEEEDQEDYLDRKESGSAMKEKIPEPDQQRRNFQCEMNESFSTKISTECSEMKSCSCAVMVSQQTTPPLPQVTLPQILQYKRESEEVELSLAGTDSTENDPPIPKGICYFCKQPIKPLLSLEEQSVLRPEEIYCCESYQEFLHMVLLTEIEEAALKLKNKVADEKPDIDIKKLKKGKGPIPDNTEIRLKVKAREMILQQKQYQAAQQFHPQLGYHMAHHMNTMNYQLSSQKCLAAGWTVCVPELEKSSQDNVFIIEPCKNTLYRSNEKHPEEPVEKFYDNGAKFFTIFPDGTGNIFYPSGKLAILISSILPYHFTYIIYGEETGRKQPVMAVFEHTGYGTCYHPNGNVRLYIDPAGGMEMSPAGPCRKKWVWQELQCHAPPLQPIYIRLNGFIGMKVLSQRNIQLNFNFKRFSCRMNLGVYVKPATVAKWIPFVDEQFLYLEDKRNQIESLLDKVRTLLQYSSSPKLDKILPPIYLTNRINKLLDRRQKLRTVNSIRARPNIQLQRSPDLERS